MMEMGRWLEQQVVSEDLAVLRLRQKLALRLADGLG